MHSQISKTLSIRRDGKTLVPRGEKENPKGCCRVPSYISASRSFSRHPLSFECPSSIDLFTFQACLATRSRELIAELLPRVPRDARRSAARSGMTRAERRGGAATVSFLLARVDPPPHHSADLYISWRVSHFRHYHSCRGSARARHTRLAVPSCRVHADRKRSHAARASTLSRAPSRRTVTCGSSRVARSPKEKRERERNCDCVRHFADFESASTQQPLAHGGARVSPWDMCATWGEPEDPPAASAVLTEWD